MWYLSKSFGILGRIKAMQLEYSEAHKYLQISSRKAPQSTATGNVDKSYLP